MAATAGLSEATVSRVLSGQSGRYRIPRRTEEVVVKTALELGYSRRQRFFQPPAMRSRLVAVIIPELSHFFLGQFARFAARRLREAGYTPVVLDSLESSGVEAELVDRALALNVDGVLALPVGREWGHMDRLIGGDVPLVLLDRVPREIECHRVSVDNYGAAVEAMEHLLSEGHRRIACIQRLPRTWINDERVRGYGDVLARGGVKPSPELLLGDQFGQHNGYIEVKRILAMKPRPTAIFSLSHLVTIEALRALDDQRIRIPDDMSLVGFDDLPHAEFFPHPVTTVRQPITEMARMAVDLLTRQIADPDPGPPMTVQLPCELVRRGSVGRVRS